MRCPTRGQCDELHVGAYYLRLMVVARRGAIADVTAVLHGIGALDAALEAPTLIRIEAG